MNVMFTETSAILLAPHDDDADIVKLNVPAAAAPLPDVPHIGCSAPFPTETLVTSPAPRVNALPARNCKTTRRSDGAPSRRKPEFIAGEFYGIISALESRPREAMCNIRILRQPGPGFPSWTLSIPSDSISTHKTPKCEDMD
ncbi:hypothetical protein LA080_002628 [Diaporthe eres]|nr:hypothetical protein LA080_002628 [Diaporthe eres]